MMIYSIRYYTYNYIKHYMILHELVLHEVLHNLYMLNYMLIYMTLHDITCQCLLPWLHACYILNYVHDYMSNYMTLNIILHELLHQLTRFYMGWVLVCTSQIRLRGSTCSTRRTRRPARLRRGGGTPLQCCGGLWCVGRARGQTLLSWCDECSRSYAKLESTFLIFPPASTFSFSIAREQPLATVTAWLSFSLSLLLCSARASWSAVVSGASAGWLSESWSTAGSGAGWLSGSGDSADSGLATSARVSPLFLKKNRKILLKKSVFSVFQKMRIALPCLKGKEPDGSALTDTSSGDRPQGLPTFCPLQACPTLASWWACNGM